MISLRADEKILLVIRRHWFVMVGPTIFGGVILLFPSLFFTIAPRLFPAIGENPALEPIINFYLSLYILMVLLYLFIFWSDYYLDIWIITTKRLIDIEQRGLFNRQISEMNLNNIQNVSVEIRGVIPTLLKFGNLRVETAGEESFTIRDAPNLYEAKDYILHHSAHLQKTPNSAVGAKPEHQPQNPSQK